MVITGSSEWVFAFHLSPTLTQAADFTHAKQRGGSARTTASIARAPSSLDDQQRLLVDCFLRIDGRCMLRETIGKEKDKLLYTFDTFKVERFN